MSSYKQEMRDPEPSKHPDERMHMTIKDARLRIGVKVVQTVDPVTGEKHGKAVKLTTGGNH